MIWCLCMCPLFRVFQRVYLWSHCAWRFLSNSKKSSIDKFIFNRHNTNMSEVRNLNFRRGWVPPQVRFCVGEGEGQSHPQTSALPPPQKIYISDYCIAAKRAFCGLQNTPKCLSGRGSTPEPAGGTHDAPTVPSAWAGVGTPLLMPNSSRWLRRIDSLAFGARFGMALPPPPKKNIFL